MHVGWDRPTVLITQGYDANFALPERYRDELSKLFDTNIVFVEHRYFDRSTPDPLDWKYLTAENSAHDLHRIRTLFASLYPGKWIASGISKGRHDDDALRHLLPRRRGYLRSLCGSRLPGRRGQALRTLSRTGGNPGSRAAVRALQTELFRRKADLLPAFSAFCDEKGYTFRIPVEEVFDYCTLEVGFALWQWGFDPAKLPSTEASDQVLLDFLLASAGPDYFSVGNAQAPFFVQAARELGYYPYDAEPFRAYTSVDTRDYLRRIFLPEELRHVKFSKRLGRRMTRYLKRNDPRMIFIYGGDDPWSAPGAAWAATPDKRNMKAFVQPGGSHRTRILTLPDSMRREVSQRCALGLRSSRRCLRRGRLLPFRPSGGGRMSPAKIIVGLHCR